MNDSKTTICPCCGEGSLHTLKRDFNAAIGDGEKLTVPNIEMDVCDRCGEEILPLESAREVEAAIADQTERLTPDELREIREQFDVDQTEMSESLGLGNKTYHRWENGTQYPSRSMGYYLRVLREYPEAFKWLRSRQWRERNHVVSRA